MTDTIPATAPTTDGLTVKQFREAGGTEDWPVLGDGALAFFRTESLAASARFVQAVADLPGIDSHPPDIDIRPDGVTVRIVTWARDWGGMTQRDVDNARRISALAREQGLTSDPTIPSSVCPVVVGAVDIPKVMPFWQALMGYLPRLDTPDEDLVDPHGRGPGLWFEPIKAREPGRNEMHIGVWVPYEQARARVDATLAAGGTLVYDKRAPAWWTLADPEGNEADIATSMSRD
jgi:4a-hydroxytetrahydrobiopterin dehydratase